MKKRKKLRNEFVATFIKGNYSLFADLDERRHSFFNFQKICDLFRPALLDFLRLYGNSEEFVKYREKRYKSHISKLRKVVKDLKKERQAKTKFFKELVKKIQKSIVLEKRRRKANLKMKRKMNKSNAKVV